MLLIQIVANVKKIEKIIKKKKTYETALIFFSQSNLLTLKDVSIFSAGNHKLLQVQQRSLRQTASSCVCHKLNPALWINYSFIILGQRIV